MVDDPAKLFMMDIEGHIEVFDYQAGRIQIDLAEDGRAVNARETRYDRGYVRVFPALAELE